MNRQSRAPRWSALLSAAALLGCLPRGYCGELAATGAAEGPGVLRYRGDYTRAHEVNSFCPATRSECYWLDNGTSTAVRDTLQALVTRHAAQPYDPVCVVVEGLIDRETPRSGFAADYNGLMRIDRVYGACRDTGIVTQGDLQHHRWALVSVDGAAVVRPPGRQHSGPALEFGERMYFAADDARQSVSGFASLEEQGIVFDLQTTGPAAGPNSVDSAFQADELGGGAWTITLPETRSLRLERQGRTLEFKLADWL